MKLAEGCPLGSGSASNPQVSISVRYRAADITRVISGISYQVPERMVFPLGARLSARLRTSIRGKAVR
jgi:hypothetical protein